jgi:hypothetical protein
MSSIPSIPIFSIVTPHKNSINDGYPLVICYIAIENWPFIVDLPIEYGDFP